MTLPSVNFVEFGVLEVWDFTAEENRILRLWRCRGAPIPHREGLRLL